MKVLFYGNVLDFTNNEKSCEVNDCQDIQELLNNVTTHFGERFREYLFGNETCFILVNGRGIMLTGGLNTKLHPGDKIEILPFTEAG